MWIAFLHNSVEHDFKCWLKWHLCESTLAIVPSTGRSHTEANAVLASVTKKIDSHTCCSNLTYLYEFNISIRTEKHVVNHGNSSECASHFIPRSLLGNLGLLCHIVVVCLEMCTLNVTFSAGCVGHPWDRVCSISQMVTCAMLAYDVACCKNEVMCVSGWCTRNFNLGFDHRCILLCPPKLVDRGGLPNGKTVLQRSTNCGASGWDGTFSECRALNTQQQDTIYKMKHIHNTFKRWNDAWMNQLHIQCLPTTYQTVNWVLELFSSCDTHVHITQSTACLALWETMWFWILSWFDRMAWTCIN